MRLQTTMREPSDTRWKQSRRAFLAASACLISACKGPPAPPAPTRITVAGSTALFPLLTAAATRYMRDHPNVSIDVSQGGSHVGLAKVAGGEVTIGASDVFAEGPKASGLVDHRVAVIGFAVMANMGPFNTAIDSLTKEEVRDIFMGKIKNWGELGGDDQPIVLINRAKGSGTRTAFGTLALGGDLFAPSEEQESNSKVQAMLQQTRGAISYLALSYRTEKLVTLGYAGVVPSAESITSNRYPLWSYEHLYTRGPPSEEVAAFIAFFTSGRFQREVLPGLGFVPLHDMRVVRDHDR